MKEVRGSVAKNATDKDIQQHPNTHGWLHSSWRKREKLVPDRRSTSFALFSVGTLLTNRCIKFKVPCFSARCDTPGAAASLFRSGKRCCAVVRKHIF